MATYTELFDLRKDDGLRNRVAVAVVIEAQTLLAGTPTTAQSKWAAKVFSNPKGEGDVALMTVLAANKGASVPQIQGATDAAIQSNVSAIVAGLVAANGA